MSTSLRLAVILACLCAAHISLGAPRAQATQSPRATDQFPLEQSLWEAYRIHSRTNLDSLLAPEFVNIDPGGEATKPQILAGLDNYHVSAVTVEVTGVTSLGKDVVLVRSHVRITHDWKGTPLPGTLSASTIWQRLAGRWRAIFHQDTANG